MSATRHWWVTREIDRRYVSVCENCGEKQDIEDLTEAEIYQLPNGPCPGEAHGSKA